MKIPPSLAPELQQALRELWASVNRITGPRNVDLHGRRLLNVGSATAPNEYVTREELLTEGVLLAELSAKVSESVSTTTASSLSGTHAQRLALVTASVGDNSTWYETDRTVTYTLLPGKVWDYTSGVMVGLYAAMPTDLGLVDTGFRYDATDTRKGYRWTGTAWEFWGSLDPPDTKPATPNTPTPADASVGASVNLTCTWVSSLATTYDVYFGTAASPTLVVSGQATASYTPTGPLANSTVHYWKIKAINVHGTRTGPIWSFTTAATAAAVPATPNTPWPADTSTGVALLTVLSWLADGATSNTVSILAIFTSTQPWEVAARETPEPGEVWEDRGVANYTMPDEQPFLTPTSRVGPSWYTCTNEEDDAWLGDASAAATPQVATVNSPRFTWAPPSLAPSRTYSWQVTANNSIGSTVGPVWTFTTGPDWAVVPDIPSSPSPSDDASNVSLTPVLTWTANGAQSFTVFFGTAASPPEVESYWVYRQYSPPMLSPGTTYYWQIQAHNLIGTVQSPIWSFTTTGAAPDVPSDPTPPDGQTGVSRTLTLGWSGATGAAWYELALGTSSPPETVSTNLTTTSYSPSLLTASKQYYWRVTACNTNVSTPGPIWSFTTAATSTTVPPTPTGHVIGISGTTFRTDTSAIWKWHGTTYFGMFADYLGSGVVSGVYPWARALGINVFRVLMMKSPNGKGSRGGAFPWAPFHPTDYTDQNIDDFLTAVEAEGFSVQLVALADCDAYTGWAGLPSVTAQQTQVDRVTEIAKGHSRAFVELANEPYNNGVDPSKLTCTDGVWICKGAGTDAAPYLPGWHYMTAHTPRDSEWPRKAKHVLDYTKLGWTSLDSTIDYPGMGIPGVCNEPMGIWTTSDSSRTNNAQDCADYFAVADLMCAGGTIHTQALGLNSVLPDPVVQGICEAIRESWEHIPTGDQLGQYTAGHLTGTDTGSPLYHDVTTAMTIYGMITDGGHRATCVVLRKGSGYTHQPQYGWSVVSTEGYGGNIVKLTRP